ncbi:UPF0262 family protein [Pararhizobium sp. YC-54]|uniref:UPF0262 family protein n=1 Tax=Pararhizobium sp. YC-54 TaxID=2986920 RepID=UPI0021F7E502|nr:UPF0262 family protein [Pararhizobium sp. YC-54]MCW0001596.1 UPF0262 family protein [Pararhizobium sp. YC-54]
MPSSFRMSAISFEPPLARQTNAARKREQDVAIFDLLDNNHFAPVDHEGGPYRLYLELKDRRLVMSVNTETGVPVLCHHLSLASFRRLLKDYWLVCESLATGAARLPPDRLEAIDMGRRAIHDEAATLLKERLKSKVEIDQKTARRLFTLVSLLVARTSFDLGQAT